MSLFDELKRRNVFRVAVAYIAVAWLIIQVVETLFPIFGLSDAAIRAIVIVLAVGFIPAVISAWAFELTPKGLVPDRDVDRASPVIHRMARRLDRLIMVVLALALSYFVVDEFLIEPDEVETRDASIAVLAFDDLSPEGDQEYFSDGIAEELLNLLAKIPELRVAGRTSAFSFKGKDATIVEIADVLDVNYVLEGSVRMAGDQIRITAQLVEARSDSHVWSETYDRTLDDIFRIQDDVAVKVVDALKVTLLGQLPHVDEIDPEAYVLTMQARHLLDQSGEEPPAEAAALLHKAWEIDPGRPRIGYELRRIYLGYRELGTLTPEEADREIAEITADMVAFDADHSFTLGALAHDADRREDLAEAVRLYQRALAADPTNVGVTKWGWALALKVGRPDIAVKLGEFTAANDPLCGTCYRMLGMVYRYTEQWDESEAAIRTAIRLGHPAEYSLVTTLLFKGDAQAALDGVDELIRRHPHPSEQLEAARAIVLHELGRYAESEAVFEKLRQMRVSENEAWWMLNVAGVYAWTGEADRAFEWLAKARAVDHERVVYPNYIEHFRNLHDDPRWPEELEKWGIKLVPPGTIDFDITLP